MAAPVPFQHPPPVADAAVGDHVEVAVAAQILRRPAGIPVVFSINNNGEKHILHGQEVHLLQRKGHGSGDMAGLIGMGAPYIAQKKFELLFPFYKAAEFFIQINTF